MKNGNITNAPIAKPPFWKIKLMFAYFTAAHGKENNNIYKETLEVSQELIKHDIAILGFQNIKSLFTWKTF